MDISYLRQKCMLLECFLAQLLFELHTPSLLLTFVGVSKARGGGLILNTTRFFLYYFISLYYTYKSLSHLYYLTILTSTILYSDQEMILGIALDIRTTGREMIVMCVIVFYCCLA